VLKVRITPWLVILILAFGVYAFFGFLSLQECLQHDDLVSCLLVKAVDK
jgi:hypothetical protein